MIVSPEYYYKNVLMGMSAERIKAEICRLESEISNLKKLARNGSKEMIGICPGVDVQISCSKDYLNCAKRALCNIEYNKNIAEENPD